MDPRLEVIEKRLNNVENLLPVASGKGGVGKSLIASTTALLLSERDLNVGLLDLDLHGPSAHIILGAEDLDFPEEEKGVLPPKVGKIKFMSTVYYSQDKPAPLRGGDISNAIKELLSITRWGDLDYLILDMPPGLGNETLDTVELIPKTEFILVTTPSKVALGTVKKLVRMLQELSVPIQGIIENMVTKKSPDLREEIKSLKVNHLGNIEYDHNLERSIGKPKEILKSKFAKQLGKSLPQLK
ncbi:MAG: ATP-binding protein [Candidatus Hadarchaeia archaeon]